MKGFRAFLDMRRQKDWNHGISSWNIQLFKDLSHQFPWSADCLTLHPELPSRHVRCSPAQEHRVQSPRGSWQMPICSWHYIYINIKKNKIMAFAATRMDLEIIILMKQVRQGKTNIWWYHLYLGSKIIQRKWIARHNPRPQSFLGRLYPYFPQIMSELGGNHIVFFLSSMKQFAILSKSLL